MNQTNGDSCEVVNCTWKSGEKAMVIDASGEMPLVKESEITTYDGEVDKEGNIYNLLGKKVRPTQIPADKMKKLMKNNKIRRERKERNSITNEMDLDK